MAATTATHRASSSTNRPLTVVTWITDKAMAADTEACLRDLPVQVAMEQAGSDWNQWLEQLEQTQPDVVLLGLKGFQGSVGAAIQRIRACTGAPAVVAVDTATEPEAVLGAIRAGAAEYVYPPVAAHLGVALERVADAQHAGMRRGKTVAFVSAKGGCGATMVACHTAVSLQHQTGKPVLLADFDLDNGVIGFLTKTRSSYTVEHAIQNADRLDPNYWKALVSQVVPGLDVICSPGSAHEQQSSEGAGEASVLEFARTQYDWVVVDLGRGLNQETRAALEAVDEIHVVTTLDVPSLYRCQQMIRTLMELGYGRDRIRLVVNRVTKNSELTKSEIEQMVGLPVSFDLPDEPGALGEAYAQGQLLPQTIDLAKRVGRIARQIAGLADEKTGRRFALPSWLSKTPDCRQQPALAVKG